MTTDKQGYYARANQRFQEEFLPLQEGKTFTTNDVYDFFGLNKYSMEKGQKIKHAFSQVLWNRVKQQLHRQHECRQQTKNNRKQNCPAMWRSR